MGVELDFLDFLQAKRTPLLDDIMIFITTLGNGGLIFIVMGIIFLLNKKERKIGLNILIALLLCGVFGNLIIKPIVQRIRPYNIRSMELLIKTPSDYSFPSGHTYSAFATAMSVYFYNRRKSVGLFIYAILMAFSRMYLYVHYPTDILAGIVFGIFFAFVSKKLLDRISEFKKKFGEYI